MRQSVEQLGSWVMIYFYLLLFFGNYICLNLMTSVCVVCYGTRSERKIARTKLAEWGKKQLSEERKPHQKDAKRMRSRTKEQLRLQARYENHFGNYPYCVVYIHDWHLLVSKIAVTNIDCS